MYLKLSPINGQYCILYQVYRTKGLSNLAQYKCVEMYTRPFSEGIPLILSRESYDGILRFV